MNGKTSDFEQYDILLMCEQEKEQNLVFMLNQLLLPMMAVEIVECVRKYVDRIFQNLQSLSLY